MIDAMLFVFGKRAKQVVTFLPSPLPLAYPNPSIFVIKDATEQGVRVDSQFYQSSEPRKRQRVSALPGDCRSSELFL